MKCSVTLP
ncbi:hypothetical protein LSH36_146g05019 [Paralvinella palmiformis]|uniref:Uncharacterized protein n=1 Tax=Paralvinella palmiformis TaxID=53620 RepID=A0AAD9JUX3_9ANNE|nr:hypothetical protein LSH36_146g05019 [Paralvinella palmiformis]